MANKSKLSLNSVESTYLLNERDDETDEHDETVGHGLNMLQVTVNLMKCAVGAGSFSVPYAFATSGIAFGLFGGIFLGIASVYTIILLCRVEKHLVRNSPDKKRLTYPQVAGLVFPFPIGKSGQLHSMIIYAFVVMTCLGGCCAYVIFIVSTLPGVISALTPWETALIIFPILVALALLRTFHYLSFTSIVGDFAIVTGFIGTFVYAYKYPGTGSIVIWEWSSTASAMGSLAFLFLSHLAVLPMSQSLKHDLKDSKRFENVVKIAYVIITVGNMAFGAIAYTQFLSDTQGLVILNLKNTTHIGSIISYLVRSLLCIDLLFTAPMLLAIGREIVEHTLMSSGYAFTHRFPHTSRNILRLFLVIIFVGVGYLANTYAQNSFYNVVSLIGGICGFSLGFIYPCAMYMKLFAKEMSTFTIALNVLLIIIGAVLLVACTYSTITQF